ncbi:alpha/beta hydrolase [Anaerovibrio sp.]|uniref:alpha/beta hydrolase n=1 Tax=Anaerovibrio sp. TaxID=1872532 RepID=UPI003F183489
MINCIKKQITGRRAARTLLAGTLALCLAIGGNSITDADVSHIVAGSGISAYTIADANPVLSNLRRISTISTAEAAKTQKKPLVIAEQGIFSAGGTVTHSEGTFDIANYYTSRAGSTSHVDHANVLYQIPDRETGLPMVFLHGYGQSRMGWMTTPDGREGWSDMFLRMGHSVFLIDQPRRGEAGQTSVAGTISTVPADQTWYTQFRIGTYRDNQFTYNENSQFPQGEKELDQFFRQMTPDTAMDSANGDQSIDNTVVAKAVAAAIDEVYEKTGKNSVLVTHSQGGRPGWGVARHTDHVAAIVAVEPGAAPSTDSEDYRILLEKKIPVVFYYGDYIGESLEGIPAAAMWARMKATADTFTAAYTAAGGNSTIVSLPDEGIYGNDHMLFQDRNNDVIARHVENWLNTTIMQAKRN